MTLFDVGAIDLSKLGPKDYTESDFHYLESSARPMASKIRDMLEGWFSFYSDKHKSELRQRFRARNGVESPLFELSLYNTLLKMQADIQIHPPVAGTEKRPDFHVRLMSGFEFYLEAVVARGTSHRDVGREKMVNAIYSVIDRKLRSPEFFFSVHILAFGANAPNSGKLVYDLSRYVSTIDLEAATEVFTASEYQGYKTKYRTIWEHEGWRIEFIPLPKKVEAVGNLDHRPLGAFIGDVGWSTAKEDIRDSVEFKIRHHNHLTKPYVIAVNSTHWSTGEDDFIDALYGSDVVTVQIKPNGANTLTNTRGRDGVWIDESGLKNENLIAVVGVPTLTPTTLASRRLVVYQNPYIDYPREAMLDPLPVVFPQHGNTLGQSQGSSMGDMFGLPIGWPLDDPDDT